MPDPDAPASPSPSGYGLGTATFVVISSMVGTGILTTSGLVVLEVGNHQTLLLLWLIGGLLALCGALSLAELASALPRSGGDYVFVHEAFGPLPAFLAGWTLLLHGFAAPIALSAVAASDYFLKAFGPGVEAPAFVHRGLATLFILTLAWAHSLGRNSTTRVQTLATGATLLGLLVFIVAGVVAGRHHGSNLASPMRVGPGGLTAAIAQLISVNYAYSGWNAAALIAGEVEKPGRNVPRAIVGGTALVIVLYLAVNLVYTLAIPADELAAIGRRDKNAVVPIAELAAGRLFGTQAGMVVSFLTGLILLASLSAFLLTGPRIAQAMARAEHFPRFAARTHARTGTPNHATAALVVTALLLLWTGTFEKLLIYSSVGLALFSMLTVTAVPILRFRRPDLSRPFRIPFSFAIPLIYLLGTATLLIATFLQEPEVSALSAAGVLVGVPVYWVYRELGARPT